MNDREGIIPLDEKAMKKLSKEIDKYIFGYKKPNIFKRILKKTKEVLNEIRKIFTR